MPKFFVKNEQITDNKITIIGEDVNHIKNVLRLKIDDNIHICNVDTSINYTCGISKINNDNIECIIFNEKASNCESNVHINIFQGLPKSDKMELIIQKSKQKKIERWQKISEVAAKQSGRDIVPKINNIVNIKNICNLINKYDIVLLAYENEKNNKLKNELTKLKNKENLKIGVIIGPEGGLEEQEVEILKEAGAKVITLGNRILRTETVALVVTGIIMYELENLEGNK